MLNALVFTTELAEFMSKSAAIKGGWGVLPEAHLGAFWCGLTCQTGLGPETNGPDVGWPDGQNGTYKKMGRPLMRAAHRCHRDG